MDVAAVAVVAATIFVWGVVSARLERADLTAPIVFVALGAVLAGLGLVDTPAAPESLKPLVEVTLVWVLFSDAARIGVSGLRHDLGRYVRLLGFGLPLTIVLGWVLAVWLLPGLDVWLALLVAAALAPTDAALGVPVVTNAAVPSRIRRLITVESGLNDGIATPIVVVAIAGAASAEGLHGAGPGEALLELAVGVVVGVALGAAGGGLLRWARRRGWAAEEFSGTAVLALALGVYAGALVVGGNGFVAAFCGGLAFAGAAGRRGPAEVRFLEEASGLVSLLVWLAFGAIAIPIMLDGLGLTVVLYAVLSLTLVRMVPVAIVTVGAGLDQATVLFVGWFGPRGLASLVFALLALEELGPDAARPVAAIAVTVLLSVIVHGASAAPLAAWYGKTVGAREHEPEGALPGVPLRGLPRRRDPEPEDGRGSTER
ncbi:cation:proton antiporter [Actinomycetospora lutea]|uniref:cation:proton antiporter domain-containing protein n=1 Tax=Actinomycetospora lutea TaxID=663604 RepID=UPI002366DA46|nr:cation:proton antiporter [Actinomycetospora lutea]MDD7941615.1 cation:proton antiporter [Actinomycetospora lutea]